MTLSDPTSGAGYAFGQILPSSHMTTIATQQPNALDIINGGAFAPGTNVLISDSGGAEFQVENLVLPAGKDTIVVDTHDVWYRGTTFPRLEAAPTSGERTIWRRQPLNVMTHNSVTSRWSSISNGFIFQDAVGAEARVITLGNMIDLATLKEVRIYCDGSFTGSDKPGPNFPVTMPSFSLYPGTKADDATADSATISYTLSAATDFASTIGNYNAPFVVVMKTGMTAMDGTGGSDIGVVIDESDTGGTGMFALQITGEASTYALSGFTIFQILCKFSVSKLTPGG